MAITRPVRPSLLVHGVAVAVAPRLAYDAETRRRTDEVVGYEVTVSQDTGAQLVIRYSTDDVTPAIFAPVGVVVDVQESREYGAFLVFQRNLTPDDLDKINSSLSAAASAKG